MLLYSLIVIVILAPPSLHGVSSQPISSAQTASFSQTASSLKNVYTAIGFFGFKNDRKASVTVSEIFNLSPRNLKAGKKHAIEDVAIQFSDTKADQHSSLGDVVATPPIDAVRHSVDAAEAAGATTALVDSLGGPKNDTTSNDAISTSSPSEYANGNSEAQDDRAGDGSTM